MKLLLQSNRNDGAVSREQGSMNSFHSTTAAVEQQMENEGEEDLLTLTATLKESVKGLGLQLREDKDVLETVQSGIERNLQDLETGNRELNLLSSKTLGMATTFGLYTFAGMLFFFALAVMLAFKKSVH